MRNTILTAVFMILVACVAAFAAEGKRDGAKLLPDQKTESRLTAEEQAIRASADAFVAAFNRGDPKEIAALWTPDGEYGDESGRIIWGRKEIEKEYARFFAKNPDVKIENTISSVKVLGKNSAIESGTTMVKTPEGKPLSRAQYTAMLLNENGKWLVASVREKASPSLSVRPGFKDLEWLVGDWAGAKDSKAVDLAFKWVVDKEFIELSYTARDKENVARSGVQIIGRDPSLDGVASWSFDSTGGLGRGQWRLFKNGCFIESAGVMPDGTPVSSTDILSKVDENTFTWQSVNRTVGGRKLNDTEPLVLKRKSR